MQFGNGPSSDIEDVTKDSCVDGFQSLYGDPWESDRIPIVLSALTFLCFVTKLMNKLYVNQITQTVNLHPNNRHTNSIIGYHNKKLYNLQGLQSIEMV